ncbi:hypothetical protein TWF694_009892 [Orbilia ellipsospora]|uniref:U1-type domain-containing protein n=1 Tax=Orbilia ellipsospora TaxID=2528407 RepID=A0AAV9XIM6_9PEZI
MSEYWVSTKRYWCERCKMFVKDSPLSRKDHEASPKHQHALQRFLRELHRNKEREAVAAENTKREAERLNNLDNPNYVPKPLARRAADLIEKPAKTNTWRSEEQKQKHLDELAALGVAMPESYRKEHAMVGEWETVRVIESAATAEDEDEDENTKRAKRRKLGEGEEEDEEDAQNRNFSVRTMEYPGDATSSGNIEDITFKKKGSSRHGVRTREYPDQSHVADLGAIVFKKRGSKTNDREEGKGIAKISDDTSPVREQDGANDSLDEALNQATREDQSQSPVLKHEPSEDKPASEEPAVEGVSFKVRKSRNANRRRI